MQETCISPFSLKNNPVPGRSPNLSFPPKNGSKAAWNKDFSSAGAVAAL
jgi:hypothetical protein